MKDHAGISLVIPVFNEGQSIAGLIATISDQSVQPSEIVLVDGGSTDNTVELVKELTKNDPRFRIILAGRAMPGKARNTGVKNATGEWIAFTDAGIALDKYWLEKLVTKAKQENAGIVYGNYSPRINTFFEKCATIAYVAPLSPGKIRGKFIASSMMKKEVWEKAGGFPDWRAAEDLIYMENAEKTGFAVALAPDAKVSWQLRPDLASTFRRFDLYSKYNVWAGRQAYWHYGVARQYLFLLFAIATIIFRSWYGLLLIPLWLMARVAKRILLHRHELGWKPFFNPAIWLGVLLITLTIDMATFSGWIKAAFGNKDQLSTS